MFKRNAGTIARIADAFTVLATVDSDGAGYFNYTDDEVTVGNITADNVTEADLERLEGLGWTVSVSQYDGDKRYAFSFAF